MLSTGNSAGPAPGENDTLCLPNVAGLYCERRPTEPLRPWLRRAWGNKLRLSGKKLVVVPGGCIDIVWTGKALIVAGPDTQPHVESVRENAILAGLRFHPGAALPWLKVSSAEIVNSRFPLADLWGDHARQIAERLFESSSSDQLEIILEQQLLSRTPDERRPYRTDHNLSRALEEGLQSGETLVRDLAIKLGI